MILCSLPAVSFTMASTFLWSQWTFPTLCRVPFVHSWSLCLCLFFFIFPLFFSLSMKGTFLPHALSLSPIFLFLSYNICISLSYCSYIMSSPISAYRFSNLTCMPFWSYSLGATWNYGISLKSFSLGKGCNIFMRLSLDMLSHMQHKLFSSIYQYKGYDKCKCYAVQSD